nr:MAG TPA: YopX protein [Caudoviricetes sp.]
MREILFRGKRTDNKKWVVDNSVLFFKNSTKIYGALNGWREVEVISETIGQYTGLTDKNGTKIFEGDIVKVRLLYSNGERATEITTVVYDENNCCYSPMNWKESCQWCDYSTSIKEIEVIGNIYDNPELLRSDIE